MFNRSRRLFLAYLVPVFAISALVLVSVTLLSDPTGPGPRSRHRPRPADRGLFQPPRRRHRGDRPGNRPGPFGDPRPGLLLHLRPDRRGPAQGAHAGDQGRSNPRQEPADAEILVVNLSRERPHPHLYRRRARHRPQQDHHHRPVGRHHGFVQLHEGRRGEERREPSHHPVEGSRQTVSRQLAAPPQSLHGVGSPATLRIFAASSRHPFDGLLRRLPARTSYSDSGVPVDMRIPTSLFASDNLDADADCPLERADADGTIYRPIKTCISAVGWAINKTITGKKGIAFKGILGNGWKAIPCRHR